MNIFDDDDEFVGTPASNFFEISRTANRNIVDMELAKMLRRLAVAERMLDERGLETEYETMMKQWVIDSEVDNRLNSIFIELVGNIVTQCE